MLDLIARRYPNKRPSDFIEGIDEIQAMEFDVALAIKYKTLEDEAQNEKIIALINTIENTIRAQGGKIEQKNLPPSVIKPYTADDEETIEELPFIEDVIQGLSGGMTYVNLDDLIKEV